FFKYWYFIRTYINNIIIFNKTAEEYFKYFRVVLGIINKYCIYISINKFFIGYPSVKLFNYIVDREGVSCINNYITTFK
ncbi:hypothetical protein GE21DRAFT_1221310, partial [Neurospora crassa]